MNCMKWARRGGVSTSGSRRVWRWAVKRSSHMIVVSIKSKVKDISYGLTWVPYVRVRVEPCKHGPGDSHIAKEIGPFGDPRANPHESPRVTTNIYACNVYLLQT